MNQENISPTEQNNWRVNFLKSTLRVACIFGLVALLPAIFTNTFIYSLLYAIVYLVLITFTFVPASYVIRGYVVVGLLFGLAVLGLTDTGIIGGARLFMIAAIAMATLLFSARLGWITTGLGMLMYIIFGWLILSGTISITSTNIRTITLEFWISSCAVMLLISALIINAIDLVQKEHKKETERSQSLFNELKAEKDLQEQHIQERTNLLAKRTNQLQAVANAGRTITSYRNLAELLKETALLINQNFGFYHIGIYLIDEHQQNAILSASNSSAGIKLLQKGYSLKIGETSIIGYVAKTSQARIALDVKEDEVFLNEPELNNTRSELALPLLVGEQLLGVLDVQSTEANAFTDDDSSTLQILADQLAVGIQNAKLFEENEKALESSRLAYGNISSQGWKKIIQNQTRLGFIATPPGVIETKATKPEPNLAKAIENGKPVLTQDGLTVNIPIQIRGQVIGAIRLKKSEVAEAWTQDETNLAISLSDQLSSALESARLYQDSQKRVARESLVSDISARLSAVTQTDLILRETVQELGEVIANTAITFQLLGQSNKGYTLQADGSLVSTNNLSKNPLFDKVTASGDTYISNSTSTDSQPTLTVPVKLREQTIGIIHLESSESPRAWNMDEITLVQTVTDRVALALENAKLLEDSQKLVAKEQAIGNISSKINATSNIEAILRTAVRELGAQLSDTQVTLEIGDGKQ